jgi:hypothetical protein
MSYNNYTYPDSFNSNLKIEETKTLEQESQYVSYKDKKLEEKKSIQDLLNFRNKVDKLEDMRSNKNFIALIINIVSTFGLLFTGGFYTGLNFFFAIFLTLILIPSFVISGIYISILKTSRNVIWFQLIGVIFTMLLFALFSGSLFSVTLWVSLLLTCFLIFVAFLEIETATRLNRVFIFNAVTYQGKKLLIFSAILIVTIGAFLSVNRVGGREYIEKTLALDTVYPKIVDPNKKGIGQQVITSLVYAELVNPLDPDKSGTFYDFLLKKINDSGTSTKSKKEFFDTFVLQNPSCKSLVEQTNKDCKDTFLVYGKKYLPAFSKDELGINPSDEKSFVTLETKLTPAIVKKIIITSFGSYYSNSFEKELKQQNPNRIYTILGKRDALSLLISLVLFAILFILSIPLNIIISIASSLIFKALKKSRFLSVNIIKEDVEILSF